MTYNNIDDIKKLGKAGAFSVDEKLGDKKIKRCRTLASYWVCVFNTRDAISECLEKDGFWESGITLWISRQIKPGSVCIDAGAGFGYFTFFLAQHGCRVYSLEANPELIPPLEYSNYLNGSKDRVVIINRAVYNRSGETIEAGLTNANGDNSINNANLDLQSFRADTLVMDELLGVEKRIDFVKFNGCNSQEQGWEGMQYIMQTNPECKCIMEFAPDNYQDKGKKFFERIQSHYNVSFIESDGSEGFVRWDFFDNSSASKTLVIRNRLSGIKTNKILSVLQLLD